MMTVGREQETPRIPYRFTPEQLHDLSEAVSALLEVPTPALLRPIYLSINHEIGVAMARMELTMTKLLTSATDGCILVFFEDREVEALAALPLPASVQEALHE